MKTAVLKNVRNSLRISLYSGTAKNLRDPWFGDKSENFWKIGQFGEWMRGEFLSICIDAAVGKVSDTAMFQK
jgi:hypothetical protein